MRGKQLAVAHHTHEDHFEFGDQGVEVLSFSGLKVSSRFLFEDIEETDGVPGGFGIGLSLAGVRIGGAEGHLYLNREGLHKIHELRRARLFGVGFFFHSAFGFEGCFFLGGLTFPVAIDFLFELYHRVFFYFLRGLISAPSSMNLCKNLLSLQTFAKKAGPMPARIAYLLEYPTVSGGERSLLCLLDYLDRSRFEPVLFAPAQGPMAEEVRARGLSHVPYEMNRDGRRRPFEEVGAELAELLIDQKISLLHGNSLSCAEYTGLVGELAGLPGIAHVRDIQKLKASRRTRLARNQKLIAVSHGTRNHMMGQGLDETLIDVVWNGIPRQFAENGRLEKDLWPSWKPGQKVVANIGQICLRKAQDLCLEAMIPLLKNDSDLHLLFVGERFSKKAESVRFEEGLHVRAEEMGLLGQIHFSAYRDDVPGILGETLILAHSAHQEPLGRVLLEAQISGVPVVAMEVGGNGEVVESGETGLLVPKGDESAFRDAVSNLLCDDKLRREMGHRAQLRAGERFDPGQSAARVMDIYQVQLFGG